MHELGIASEIRRQCLALLPDAGQARIERVRVRVGELSAVEPDLLRYAWEAVIAGGAHAGAALEVEWCPARQCCAACHTEVARARGEWHERCPSCGRTLSVEGGQELELVEFACAPLAAGEEAHR
jgi:hydrogenase nickel incorporation protein HypA/HybF